MAAAAPCAACDAGDLERCPSCVAAPPVDHSAHAGAACHDDGCGGCGVSLDECDACHGVGYHRAGCVESDEVAS